VAVLILDEEFLVKHFYGHSRRILGGFWIGSDVFSVLSTPVAEKHCAIAHGQ